MRENYDHHSCEKSLAFHFANISNLMGFIDFFNKEILTNFIFFKVYFFTQPVF